MCAHQNLLLFGPVIRERPKKKKKKIEETRIIEQQKSRN